MSVRVIVAMMKISIAIRMLIKWTLALLRMISATMACRTTVINNFYPSTVPITNIISTTITIKTRYCAALQLLGLFTLLNPAIGAMMVAVFLLVATIIAIAVVIATMRRVLHWVIADTVEAVGVNGPHGMPSDDKKLLLTILIGDNDELVKKIGRLLLGNGIRVLRFVVMTILVVVILER